MTAEKMVRDLWRELYWRAFQGQEMFPGSKLSEQENLDVCNQYIRDCCGEDTWEDFLIDFTESFYEKHGPCDVSVESILNIRQEVREAAGKWWRENTGKDGRCTL